MPISLNMHAPEEVAELIVAWDKEPYWALESTPGFEDHWQELRAHRISHHARQEAEMRRGPVAAGKQPASIASSIDVARLPVVRTPDTVRNRNERVAFHSKLGGFT
jgi:hypothetical protein